jgi:hypothetical protein
MGGLLVPLAAATDFEVVSSETTDAFGSTGTEIVLVTLLDANWEEVSVVVIMNGQTAVSIPGQYLRVRSIIGVQSNSGTAGQSWNNGNIDVREVATPANIHVRARPTNNSSFSGFYSVPDGQIVRAVNVAPLVAKNDEVKLKPYLILPDGTTISGQPIPLFEGNISLRLFDPLGITSRQDFVFRGQSLSAGTADVALIVELLIEHVN